MLQLRRREVIVFYGITWPEKLNVFKSLKALAGDDDSIFVILDDRDDPW